MGMKNGMNLKSYTNSISAHASSKCLLNLHVYTTNKLIKIFCFNIFLLLLFQYLASKTLNA